MWIYMCVYIYIYIKFLNTHIYIIFIYIYIYKIFKLSPIFTNRGNLLLLTTYWN